MAGSAAPLATHRVQEEGGVVGTLASRADEWVFFSLNKEETLKAS